jgi:hypothetical protein
MSKITVEDKCTQVGDNTPTFHEITIRIEDDGVNLADVTFSGAYVNSLKHALGAVEMELGLIAPPPMEPPAE